MMTTWKIPIYTKTIIVCLLALCMLLPSCTTEPSSEPLPEPGKTSEQETMPAPTKTSETAFTESPSEPLPEPSKIPEQETPEVQSISVDDLRDKLEDGSPIILVDIRKKDDFLTNHIEGAVSIPLDEIPERYEEIPQDREIIIYASCA